MSYLKTETSLFAKNGSKVASLLRCTPLRDVAFVAIIKNLTFLVKRQICAPAAFKVTSAVLSPPI